MEMSLSISEREELRKFQRILCGCSGYARVTCLLMLHKGYKPSAVSECLGIDISTVYRYRSSYLHGGVGELFENRHKGYWGMLDSRQFAALQKELCEHIYTDAKSVREWIKTTFGVEYTSQGVVDLRELVEETKIKKNFFPPYSLNLNLVERLWRFLRKRVINTGFYIYRSKEESRRAIKRFFDNIGIFKEELETLLTLNFRLCNSQSISF